VVEQNLFVLGQIGHEYGGVSHLDGDVLSDYPLDEGRFAVTNGALS
jgi:hypothetical protein